MIKLSYIPTKHTTLSSIICLNKDIIDMYSMFAINIITYEYLTNLNLNIILITICSWLSLCFHDTHLIHISLTIITCANIMKYMSIYSNQHVITLMYILLNSTWIVFLFVSNKVMILEVMLLILFGIQYITDNIKYFLSM